MFFPLIRGKHSFEAIAKIRDTTQLFLDRGIRRNGGQHCINALALDTPLEYAKHVLKGEMETWENEQDDVIKKSRHYMLL